MAATTSLHRSIIQRLWVNVADDLESEEATEWCRITFKDDLPLHMACERSAPAELILAILRLNPDAAAHKGRMGCLPIHHAARLGLDTDILRSLVEVHPDGLDTEDDRECTPRQQHRRTMIEQEALDMLDRPTECWRDIFRNEHKFAGLQRQMSELREQKWKLQQTLQQTRPRLRLLRDRLDRLEPRGISALGYMEEVKTMEYRLEQLEETLFIKSLMFREKMNDAEQTVQTLIMPRSSSSSSLLSLNHHHNKKNKNGSGAGAAVSMKQKRDDAKAMRKYADGAVKHMDTFDRNMRDAALLFDRIKDEHDKHRSLSSSSSS